MAAERRQEEGGDDDSSPVEAAARQQEGGRWIRLAAERGHARALFQLGEWETDAGRPTSALRWYLLAASARHRVASALVGHYYAAGLGGVERNPQLATYHRSRAIESDDDDDDSTDDDSADDAKASDFGGSMSGDSDDDGDTPSPL